MRPAVMVFALALSIGAAAAAQAQVPEQHPYGLDPYKPSDVFLLRNYGATLVAQTPLLELRQLDPYKPSHAALLREIGGALPLWGLLWYPPPPMPAPLSPFPAPAAGVNSAGQSVVIDVPPDDRRLPRLPTPGDLLRPDRAPLPRPQGPPAGIEVSSPVQAAQPVFEYQLIAASETLTPQDELSREAVKAGYELVGTVTGQTAGGEPQRMAVVRRPKAP